jgi:hypothetical protein
MTRHPFQKPWENFMGAVKIAATGLLGYGIYRWFAHRPSSRRAAFAAGEANGGGFSQVRNAGPAAMASDTPHWDRVDEASDESFPASDAPATY